MMRRFATRRERKQKLRDMRPSFLQITDNGCFAMDS